MRQINIPFKKRSLELLMMGTSMKKKKNNKQGNKLNFSKSKKESGFEWTLMRSHIKQNNLPLITKGIKTMKTSTNRGENQKFCRNVRKCSNQKTISYSLKPFTYV